MAKKNHRILKGILKIFLAIIVIIVLFVGGFIGYSVYKNGWGLKSLIKTAVGSTKEAEELEEFQVLILGISEDIMDIVGQVKGFTEISNGQEAADHGGSGRPEIPSGAPAARGLRAVPCVPLRQIRQLLLCEGNQKL